MKKTGNRGGDGGRNAVKDAAKTILAAAGILGLALLAWSQNASERNMRERLAERALRHLPAETGLRLGYTPRESADLILAAGPKAAAGAEGGAEGPGAAAADECAP